MAYRIGVNGEQFFMANMSVIRPRLNNDDGRPLVVHKNHPSKKDKHVDLWLCHSLKIMRPNPQIKTTEGSGKSNFPAFEEGFSDFRIYGMMMKISNLH